MIYTFTAPITIELPTLLPRWQWQTITQPAAIEIARDYKAYGVKAAIEDQTDAVYHHGIGPSNPSQSAYSLIVVERSIGTHFLLDYEEDEVIEDLPQAFPIGTILLAQELMNASIDTSGPLELTCYHFAQRLRDEPDRYKDLLP